jgi:hypothetical protein
VTIAIRLLNYPFAGAHVGNTRAAVMDCTWRCRLNSQEIQFLIFLNSIKRYEINRRNFPIDEESFSCEAEKKHEQRKYIDHTNLLLHFLHFTIFLIIRMSFLCIVTLMSRFNFFRNLFTSHLYTLLSQMKSFSRFTF